MTLIPLIKFSFGKFFRRKKSAESAKSFNQRLKNHHNLCQSQLICD